MSHVLASELPKGINESGKARVPVSIGLISSNEAYIGELQVQWTAVNHPLLHK